MMELHWSRTSRQTWTDAGLATAFASGAVAPIFIINDKSAMGWAIGWSLLMCCGIALRRAAPMFALTVTVLAGVGMVATVTMPLPALLTVPVVAYSVARYQDWSAAPFVLVSAVFGAIAGPYTWTREIAAPYRSMGAAVVMALCFAVVAVAYLAGRVIRESRINEHLDREIATQRFTAAQHESRQANQIAVGRARAEVAQELHDVLAHSLSIIVVQAEGARALTSKRPEAAADALTVIADTGRRSIEEVRRIVALMRGEDEAPDFGPSPSLSDIITLVETAGERVTLNVDGDVPLVPESMGLVVFRVVQESLTNFLKHAGPTAMCDVVLRYSESGIEVVVRDDGIGAMSQSDGNGSGVPGMRERVLSMGGEFTAGPRHGGGYQVRARLPMPSRLGKGWLRGV